MPTTQGVEMHMEFWHLFININEGGNLNFLCFVCHVEVSPNQTTSCCAIGTMGKSLTNRGALIWFPNVSTYGEKVNKKWIKIHLNQNLKL